METRELLNYLEKLEIGLSSFSFGELGTVEAVELKKSFDRFKHGLQDKVFGVDAMEQLSALYEKVGIQGLERSGDRTGLPMTREADLENLLDRLESTPLNQEQREIVTTLRKLAKHPLETISPVGENPESQTKSPYLEFMGKDLEPDSPAHEIGLKTVLEACMGHMDLLEETVRIFDRNLLEFIGCSKIQLEREDFTALEQACQKVVPSLRMLKTHGLLETVQEMAVQCGTDRDRRYLDFLYGQFLKETPGIQERINFELELLRSM